MNNCNNSQHIDCTENFNHSEEEKGYRVPKSVSGDNSAMIKSIFLLILAVSGNFVGETLGCKEQMYMSNNMYVKHGILLIMIYFTLHFTASRVPHPLEAAKKTVMIWIMFIFFTKMSVGFTLTGLIFLIVFYVISNFIDYDEQEYNDEMHVKSSNNEKEKLTKTYNSKKYNYQKAQSWILFILIGVILVGFVTYTLKKREEYKDQFDITTFLLGVTQCKSSHE